MDKMHSQRGKKVKFTGVVDVETVIVIVPIPSVLFPLEQTGRCGTDVNVIHQKPGSHCALNSVASGIFVPAVLYDAIYKTDPSLEEVIESLSGKVCRLTKVGKQLRSSGMAISASARGFLLSSMGHIVSPGTVIGNC